MYDPELRLADSIDSIDFVDGYFWQPDSFIDNGSAVGLEKAADFANRFFYELVFLDRQDTFDINFVECLIVASRQANVIPLALPVGP